MKNGTHSKAGRPVPRQSLNHIFQSNIIANQILVSSKDQHRDLRKHPGEDSNSRLGGFFPERAMDVRPTFDPASGMCGCVQCAGDVGTL